MKLASYLFVGAVALGLSACASTPKEAPVTASSPTASGAKSGGVSPSELEIRQMQEAMQQLNSKSIFFDYDKFVIKPEYLPLVQQQAELLKRYGKLSVALQGNADERGSAEYNLALGQKRAEAVRKALVLLGVPNARLEAVSFGKEKPRATCSEERCWSQNRRVDFATKAQ